MLFKHNKKKQKKHVIKYIYFLNIIEKISNKGRKKTTLWAIYMVYLVNTYRLTL
jgi:hypothetical protein